MNIGIRDQGEMIVEYWNQRPGGDDVEYWNQRPRGDDS